MAEAAYAEVLETPGQVINPGRPGVCGHACRMSPTSSRFGGEFGGQKKYEAYFTFAISIK
jgi:hypothetical protein